MILAGQVVAAIITAICVPPCAAWYQLLTRTADCTASTRRSPSRRFSRRWSLVKQYGFTDYELRLAGSYQPREYCVQYRESDFNFLSRLLEHERGIYFFFEHAAAKHTLVARR